MSAVPAPNKLQRSLMRLDEAPVFLRGFVQKEWLWLPHRLAFLV